MSEIIHAPNSVLSKVADQITGSPPRIDESLISEMEKSLTNAKEPKGVGLAAPQIGLSLSLFITKPTDKSKINVFLNPRILEETSITDQEKNDKTKKGLSKAKGARRRNKKLEGCLSLPNIWGTVKRADGVVLSFYDEHGTHHKKRFKGFMAIIVQHEVDHLNGILFPKKVLEQKGKLYQSHKNDKGELVFDPIEI